MNRLDRLRQQLLDLDARREAERSELLDLANSAEDLTDDQEARYAELSPRFTARDGQPSWAEDADRSRVTAEIASLEVVERGFQNGHVERPASPTFYRQNTDDPYSPGVEHGRSGEVRDAAMRAVERDRDLTDAQRGGVERSMRIDDNRGTLARHIVTTGRPEYRSAFAKFIQGHQHLLDDDERRAVREQRAGGLTDASGGYAVPFVIDNTLIDTGVHDGAYHEWRQLATVTQVLGDNWQGVSSAGVSASMVGEATEADDNFPTIAQPTIAVKKAQAFLPFSIEIDQDWPALQSELNNALTIGKGELEDVQFTTGSGSGNNVNGIVTDLVAASTPIVTSTTSNAIAMVDITKVDSALGQRFRRNASWLTTRTVMNVVRNLDTSGGAALWVQLVAGIPATMLGYPVHETPNMDSTYGSGENYVAILGDIRQAYRIIDRVGMFVDLVPHLFGNNNNYPTGQRGLYAYWRFGAKTVNTTAAKILNVT